ncbi:hypothetical protein LS73_003450 [Helicobacter muridarum]|uniref:CDP-Glycerol:Poly(Glycerophosphate) glycerophosphotransferase n=1 Tax=Helicobacter muridarum TaxID=216 RepID=A0A099U0C1_9HELI|nr:CDP-glycerol glycerophosphotransferase family protein [Helicobacter muridarum]TLE00961.1 hypothetical protein LS73_003450 [Helicobacter muridarum]STQ86750.1 CDP-Glycerol:Poly(glycerophosphate) glycerophosphotransferase [Helicobacter muridarum]
MRIFYLCVIFAIAPNMAFAYLDPGTGSLLISSFVAIIASGIFVYKNIFYKVIGIIRGGSIKRAKNTRNNALVFYSEGKQYHNVFKPILEYLDSIQYPYTYLTSSKEDFLPYYNKSKYISNNAQISLESTPDTLMPGEYKNNKQATFEYIGSSDSNKAITRLNSLRADVVMMTTPQLDVLQLKRSKGVKHYCHIIHSLPHVDNYEIFALDYFDSVFTNSPIHTDYIHEVERIRSLHTKQVVITGCSYLDELAKKLEAYKKSSKKIRFFNNDKKTILIAPSWGREAILRKYGLKLIKPLADSKFNVIIRPHPQTLIAEKEHIDKIKEALSGYDNIAWDTNRDNIYAMDNAELMVGDFSGVLFDFVCLFEKPVLTPDFNFNVIGYDLEDTGRTPWVEWALKQIGRKIKIEDLDNIAYIIESMLSYDEHADQLKANIEEMKKNLWHFKGKAGEKSAKEILKIRFNILKNELGGQALLYDELRSLEEIIKEKVA